MKVDQNNFNNVVRAALVVSASARARSLFSLKSVYLLSRVSSASSMCARKDKYFIYDE
jgi:hypothetical protein